MILDVLVFALGFMVAGLLALAALPAVWRRALRLTEERLSRLVPLSAEEIAAERDHLRAAHAVALRRLEQKLEGSEADRTALRVEAARREGRIAALDEAAVRAQVRLAERDAERDAHRRDAAELRAEQGAEALALDGLARLAERRLADIAALQAERDALGLEVDRNRGSLAGLVTRLMGAEARGGDLERELAQARQDAAAAATAAATTAAERLMADREAAMAAARAAVEASERADAADKGHGLPAPADLAHEVDSLKAELAFMAEQALSAERRATESLKAYEALKEAAEARAAQAQAAGGEPPIGGEGAAVPALPGPALPPRDDAALRAAVAALADELLRAARPPAGA